jgi:hypothetical protein
VEAHTYQVPKSGPEEAPRVADAVAKLLTRDEKGELAIVRQIRKWMDEAVTVPGTKFKFGLDSIIGLIPGVGDASSAAIGGYMLHAAHKLGVPTIVMVRMLFNLLVDALIGLIPIVGDYLDVLYKANSKNSKLIEEAVVGVFAVFLLIVLGGIVGTVFLVKWLWTAIG